MCILDKIEKFGIFHCQAASSCKYSFYSSTAHRLLPGCAGDVVCLVQGTLRWRAHSVWHALVSHPRRGRSCGRSCRAGCTKIQGL